VLADDACLIERGGAGVHSGANGGRGARRQAHAEEVLGLPAVRAVEQLTESACADEETALDGRIGHENPMTLDVQSSYMWLVTVVNRGLYDVTDSGHARRR
jgi:hypothetical protein